MKFWRMSMRNGTRGQSMVPECTKFGVAAISYSALERTDLSKYPQGEPKNLWNRLTSSQKARLRRLAYEMAEGDLIYLKDGPNIIDRGIVTGKYSFDSDFRILDGNGSPWAHQVHVDWSRQFTPIKIQLGKSQQLTVEALLSNEAARIEKAADTSKSSKDRRDEPEAPAPLRLGGLVEDAYYRESPARLKFIIPRHNKLSNDFCKWLEVKHKITAAQEQQRVDIRFNLAGLAVLAELKICFGVGTTRSIREALGQLLEYNHYSARKAASSWLIVLDQEPLEQDRLYILTLREKLSMPVTIGWSTGEGFLFYPKWPEL
jgi:hypothetical protein